MSAEDLMHAQIGPYHLLDKVGAGGVAEVYRGQHIENRGLAAVKVMHRQLVDDKAQRQHFEDEFHLLESLDHPGIPKARRLGEVKGRPAMVLEFIEGSSLSALLGQRQGFDLVGCFVAMCGIVAYVHQQGLVHNDLKLENFLLGPKGRLALVDFGSCRRPREHGLLRRLFTRASGPPGVFGTPTYIAPETLTGGEVTCASDCYSLGVCAHLLFSGVPPFSATRRTRLLNKAVNDEAPALRDKVPVLPRPLADLIDRCLIKDPRQRPEDAGYLKNAFRDFFAIETHPRPQALSVLIQKALPPL